MKKRDRYRMEEKYCDVGVKGLFLLPPSISGRKRSVYYQLRNLFVKSFWAKHPSGAFWCSR